MKAAVITKKGVLQYSNWPEDKPGKGEIKVRMRCCGICGSDVPRIVGDGAHFYPIVIGHEFSGDVVEIGEGVESLGVGDRIACAPLVPCMKCVECQTGNYALCKNYSFIGTRRPGGFAQFVTMPAQNAVALPENASYEMGAFMEPATVAMHGILASEFQGGSDVAVIGAGNIGAMTVQLAKIWGAKSVTVFDVSDERLAIAKRLGADVAINTASDFDLNEFEQTYPYVFETAGQPSAIKTGFRIVAKNGRFTCVGTPHSQVVFDWTEWEQLNRKEFTLKGTWMSYSAPFPGREWDLVAHYFGSGKLRIDDEMIFARVDLSDAQKIVDMFSVPGNVTGKVFLKNDEI